MYSFVSHFIWIEILIHYQNCPLNTQLSSISTDDRMEFSSGKWPITVLQPPILSQGYVPTF